jgi:hypothetical protein
MRIDPCASQRGLKVRKNEMLLLSRASAMSTSTLAQPLLISLLALAFFCQPGYAQKGDRVPLSPKILQAKSVFLDCDCRKEMAGSVRSALPEVLDWGRYQLARDRDHADLIFLFSMNPYLGDYFTRDGPDRRPAIVDYTILTVIDGHTGEALWSDWKRWGYMLVSRASRALVRDLRVAVEGKLQLDSESPSR